MAADNPFTVYLETPVLACDYNSNFTESDETIVLSLELVAVFYNLITGFEVDLIFSIISSEIIINGLDLVKISSPSTIPLKSSLSVTSVEVVSESSSIDKDLSFYNSKSLVISIFLTTA